LTSSRIKESNHALIVDLCGTLVVENTTRGFLEWLPLRGVRSFIRWLGLSRVSSLIGVVMGKDVSRVLLIFALRGLRRDLLYKEAATYVRHCLESLLNQDVADAISAARGLRIPIYLATASLDPIALAVSEQMQLDGMVSSRLNYDADGTCTGRLSVDITGKKLTHLQSIVPDSLIHAATVYTDNWDDVELIRHSESAYFLGKREQLTALSDSELANVSFLRKLPEAPRGFD